MDDFDDNAFTDGGSATSAGDDGAADLSAQPSAVVVEEDTPESLMAFAASLRKTFEDTPLGEPPASDTLLAQPLIDDPNTEINEAIPAIPGGYIPADGEDSYAYKRIEQRREEAKKIPTVEPTLNTKAEVNRVRNQILEATAATKGTKK